MSDQYEIETENHNENLFSQVTPGYPVEEAVEDYINDIESVFSGVLATNPRPDAKNAGFPFTSIVPISFTKDGEAVFMGADISQHGRNIANDNRVALFLHEPVDRANVQTAWRLTVNGRAIEIPGDDPAAELYYHLYPSARSYHSMHKFTFYRLEPEMSYMVQNFGKIGWIDPRDVARPCPLSYDEIFGAIKHMNEDHNDSLYTYLENAGIPFDRERKIEIANLNHRLFVIRHQAKLYSIKFPLPVNSIDEVRKEMISMSKSYN